SNIVAPFRILNRMVKYSYGCSMCQFNSCGKTVEVSAAGRDQDSSAPELAVPQSIESVIGLGKAEGFNVSTYRHVWCDCHEIFRILPGEIGDRTDDAFAPQQLIRKLRDVAHVDSTAHNNASFPNNSKRTRNEITYRRKDNGCIELHWRLFG